jgi:hypothetical protein
VPRGAGEERQSGGELERVHRALANLIERVADQRLGYGLVLLFGVQPQDDPGTVPGAECVDGRSPVDSGWWSELDPPRTDVVRDPAGRVWGWSSMSPVASGCPGRRSASISARRIHRRLAGFQLEG